MKFVTRNKSLLTAWQTKVVTSLPTPYSESKQRRRVTRRRNKNREINPVEILKHNRETNFIAGSLNNYAKIPQSSRVRWRKKQPQVSLIIN